jgi:hypothetical protein
MEQINQKIDLTVTKEVTCPSCNGNVFESVVLLRKISKILVGTAQDALIPIDVMACKKCGELLDETLPIQLREDKAPKNASKIELS